MKITTIGIDLAKNVFQGHGVDERGNTVLRKQIKRDRLAPVPGRNGSGRRRVSAARRRSGDSLGAGEAGEGGFYHRRAPIKKPRPVVAPIGVFWVGCLAVTYFHMGEPHYHRR
jgi:hypothetical protein